MSVHIFVEGGGDQARTQTACRKAFRLFFEKVLQDRLKPTIVACGSRDSAYRDFCISLENDQSIFAILLVDAEGPVLAGRNASQHLRDRDRHWTTNLPDDQVHLMVQCMEAWFLADRAALVNYYGQDFRESALPGNPNIEAVSKVDVLNGLERATKDTNKGSYHKTKHGFPILECIDPNAVRERSDHADALFRVLLTKLPLR